MLKDQKTIKYYRVQGTKMKVSYALQQIIEITVYEKSQNSKNKTK